MIWIIAGILILAVVFYFAHKLSLGFIGREEPVENPLPNPNDDWYEYMQDYYASKKHMADAPHEDLEILSEDGLRLRGRLYRIKPDNHKVVIGFHGYRGSAEADIGRFMKMYEHAGYDCLAISERAHNDSEGKYVTFGVRESKDGILWVKEILRLYGNDVILLIHGVSMGGATVLMMSGNPSLPSQVKAVISDCAYDTLTKEAGSALTQYSPFMQKVVLGILNINAKLFAKQWNIPAGTDTKDYWTPILCSNRGLGFAPSKRIKNVITPHVGMDYHPMTEQEAWRFVNNELLKA